LPYEDFMMHATDVWVAQLGVPATADLWLRGAADETSGRFRAGQAIVKGVPGAVAESNTHGGFDNDPYTMNSILRRILGAKPAVPFSERDLQF
jgi:hypothetical protein